MTNNKNRVKIVIIIAVAVFLTVAIFVSATMLTFFTLDNIQQTKIETLKDALTDEVWTAYNQDLSMKLSFEFTDEYLHYKGKFLGLDSREKTLSKFDYHIVDDKTIFVNDMYVKVEVEDGYVVFTPSFIDSREILVCEKLN